MLNKSLEKIFNICGNNADPEGVWTQKEDNSKLVCEMLALTA